MATPVLILKNLQIGILGIFQMHWASLLGPSSIGQMCLFDSAPFHLGVMAYFLIINPPR
jgi:hypothetical protein